LKPVRMLSESFPSPPLTGLVHIFVRIPSVPDLSGVVVEKLKLNHDRLFRCLTVKVVKALDWTEHDVGLNKGIFLKNDGEIPAEMKDLESRLAKRRSFSESHPRKDNLTNLTMARLCPPFPWSYAPKTTQPNDQAMVRNDLEFLAFYNLWFWYLPDAPRYQGRKASSIKATAVKSSFIHPPFFCGGNSADELVYVEESPWRFPMFVECDAMADLPLKYCPRNDFCVWFERGSVTLPLVIGGIISFRNEKDRFRMLLQAIALARLVSELRKSGSTAQPFIVAIYVTGELRAERYIVMKKRRAESNEVFIMRKDFDLAEEDGAINFQREMYNLASILKSMISELDGKQCMELEALKQDASGMKSLHTGGARKTHETDGKEGYMDTIPEEGRGSEPQDGDGQGSEPGNEGDLG